MNDLICGRAFKTTRPGPEGHVPEKTQARKPYGRILVDGINHPGGRPIRFRSVANAERHIKNMRLEIAA